MLTIKNIWLFEPPSCPFMEELVPIQVKGQVLALHTKFRTND